MIVLTKDEKIKLYNYTIEGNHPSITLFINEYKKNHPILDGDSVTNEILHHVVDDGPFEKQMIHLAAEKDQFGVIGYLVENGVNVDSKAGMDLTPLHFAAKKNNPASYNLLIANKANADAVSTGGLAAIHHAAMCNATDIIEILISQSKVDIDLLSGEKATAAMLADSFKKNEALLLLLLLGAKADNCNNFNNSEVKFYCSLKEVLSKLDKLDKNTTPAVKELIIKSRQDLVDSYLNILKNPQNNSIQFKLFVETISRVSAKLDEFIETKKSFELEAKLARKEVALIDKAHHNKYRLASLVIQENQLSLNQYPNNTISIENPKNNTRSYLSKNSDFANFIMAFFDKKTTHQKEKTNQRYQNNNQG